MKTSKVLEKALKWFGPDGKKWTKGNYYERDKKGNVCKACSIGAIRIVDGPYSKTETWFHEFIYKLHGEEACMNGIRWNDRAGRTFTTIRSVFKKAILKAKEEEAA